MKKLLAQSLTAFFALSIWASSLLAQSVLSPFSFGTQRPTATPPWAHKLSGTITDPSGAPASGVEVMLFPRTSNQAISVTDSKGRYEVVYMPLGDGPLGTTCCLFARDLARNLAVLHEVTNGLTMVELPSRNRGQNQPLQMQNITNDITGLDLRLQPGMTLTTTVLDSNGRPITNATGELTIFWGRSGTGWNPPFKADSQGRIQITAMPRLEKSWLAIQAGGFGQTNLSFNLTNTDETAFNWQVTLTTADRQLAGRVLDLRGKPAAGANVSINGAGQPFQNAVTDDQGKFKFEQVVPGPLSVSASQSGGSDRVQAKAGDLDLVLRMSPQFRNLPPTNFSGTLSDPSGAPAAGLKVFLVPVRNAEVPTDAEGRFEIHWDHSLGYATVPYWLFVADLPRNLAGLKRIDNSPADFDLKLEPGTILSVKLQDESGRPVKGASLKLTLNWGGRLGLGSLFQSDAQGRVDIRAVPQGVPVGLDITADGFGPATLDFNAEDTYVPRLEPPPVTLKAANLQVAGQVLDADGRPLSSSSVRLGGSGQIGATARTDDQGVFKFDKVVAGPVTLSVNRGNLSGKAAASAGDMNITIRLAPPPNRNPPVTITGTVTGPSGAPASGVLMAISPRATEITNEIFTDAAGRYSLTWRPAPSPLPIASATSIVADDSDHKLVARARVDATTTKMDLRLGPASSVTGAIIDPSGTPLGSGRVQWTSYLGTNTAVLERQTVHADEHGVFQITAIAQGLRLELRFEADGHGAIVKELTVDDLADISLKLPPMLLLPIDRDLAGLVLDENDQPVTNAIITVYGPGLPGAGRTNTDAQGHFHLRTTDGAANVRASSRGNYAIVPAQGGDTNIVVKLGGTRGTGTGARGPDAVRQN